MTTKIVTPRTPITDDQRTKLGRLAKCTMLPGSWDKRFVRDLQGAEELTVNQAEQIDRLYHRYRRQITGKKP